MIIKLTEKGVFYNHNEYIDWGDTNFPPKETFGLNDRYEICWEMKQVSFDKSEGKLLFEPIKYEIKREDEFNAQRPKYPIKKLEFRKVNKNELVKHLYKYQPNLFSKFTYQPEAKENEPVYQGSLPPRMIDRRLIGKHDFQFRISLKKVTFKYGFVEFEKAFNELGCYETIRLENSFILPEFEFIKPFFYKIFGKRTINVSGFIEYLPSGETSMHFTSKEISSINEKFIDNVKKIMIQDSLKRNQIISVDKSLFTSDNFFEGLHEEKFSDKISPSEKEILNIIIESKGVRNRKQLEYLAGKIQTKGEKLRFTLNPNFGFLFFHRGENNFHFIWELIDSHATYIWTFESSSKIKNSLQRIEEIISFIRACGRMAYINNAEETFNKIIHKGSNLKDSFPSWRHEINSLLT